CYVSHKSADARYRDEIAQMGIDTAANIYDGSADYDDGGIALKLRRGSLADAPVTIHLIGATSAERLGWEKQKYIKREIQASMLPSGDGLPNAIVGVVLPEAYGSVYAGSAARINDATTVREFSSAYIACPCCALLRWDDFKADPQKYIMEVYAARPAAAG
ncbi:MAG: hypothetical protein AAGU77_08490, partial [Bacillota bacterium]